jgi:membrane carboxypeptidase/penicillin-binding protein
VWVGYDQERPLGEAEEGAHTALPIWIHFMREALKGVPQEKTPDAGWHRDVAHLPSDRGPGERRESRRHF